MLPEMRKDCPADIAWRRISLFALGNSDQWQTCDACDENLCFVRHVEKGMVCALRLMRSEFYTQNTLDFNGNLSATTLSA